VTLKPEIKLAPGSDIARARELQDASKEKCFIANSVNFPVEHLPIITLVRETTAVEASKAAES
jgi:organic hydroperoxide reductase OsmC/OhrA